MVEYVATGQGGPEVVAAHVFLAGLTGEHGFEVAHGDGHAHFAVNGHVA